jgi:hypothetical protein
MPFEKFYDPSMVEGQFDPTLAFAPGQVFNVAWGVPVGDLPGIVTIAGVQLDRSGVERLIKVLRRAKRKAMPDWITPGYHDQA